MFTEEETPLQAILLEQLAKIVVSLSKRFFTYLQEGLGKLPSGRTVLGTLVDPLGVWRTSPFVQMNELDKKTTETTKNKSLIINNQEGSSKNDNDKENNIEQSSAANSLLNDLSREEVVKLSTTIVNKVWERCNTIQQTGKQFMTQLFTLVANKLEKGERDTRKVPVPGQRQEKENQQQKNNMTELSRSKVSQTIPIHKILPPSSIPVSINDSTDTKNVVIAGVSLDKVAAAAEAILMANRLEQPDDDLPIYLSNASSNSVCNYLHPVYSYCQHN